MGDSINAVISAKIAAVKFWQGFRRTAVARALFIVQGQNDLVDCISVLIADDKLNVMPARSSTFHMDGASASLGLVIQAN